MQTLLVNAIVPEPAAEACAFCRSRRESQLMVLKRFSAEAWKVNGDICSPPARHRDSRGSDLLLQHFNSWRRLRSSKTEDNRVGLQNRPVAVKNVTKAKQKNERKRTDKVAAK
jgi:hypothetical protein